MRILALLLAFAGCPKPAAPPAPTAPTPAPPPTRTPAAAQPDKLVRWSNVETVEGCFYFSGPFNGRDESLRGEARIRNDSGRARMQLGHAIFDGTLADESLELTRTTQREHEGTWTVTETITGTYRDGVLRAKYRYQECGPNEPCPGRCTMTADMSTR